MAGISSTLVKTLREKTGAGVIACKNALVETQGDARARPPRNRGQRKSNASARRYRPRPAARSMRVPCNMPALPPAKRAACSPGRDAMPPASTPISRSRDRRRTRRRCPSRCCRRRRRRRWRRAARRLLETSAACFTTDHRLEFPHHERIRMRPEHRSEQVVACRRRW